MNLVKTLENVKKENSSIAIAVEGGGLRSVASAAMLNIFAQKNMSDQVKAISGTSSGAINAAYFLTGQMPLLLNLYQTMASPKFLQPWRWPDAMNLNFLFEEQIKKTFPLNLAKVLRHPTPFYISVTDTESGAGSFILAQDCKTEDELFRALRASASAPLACTNMETIGDKKYNDGHVQLSIPFEAISPEKFDHTFCLLTQKKGYRKKASVSGDFYTRLTLRHMSSRYLRSFLQASTVYNQQLETIFASSRWTPVYLESEDFLVSKVCWNPNDVRKCIESVNAKFLKP